MPSNPTNSTEATPQDNPVTTPVANPVLRTETLKYIGPDYPDGARLLAYGREINPKSWTPAEYELWTSIDDRYKVFFK